MKHPTFSLRLLFCLNFPLAGDLILALARRQFQGSHLHIRTEATGSLRESPSIYVTGILLPGGFTLPLKVFQRTAVFDGHDAMLLVQELNVHIDDQAKPGITLAKFQEGGNIAPHYVQCFPGSLDLEWL